MALDLLASEVWQELDKDDFELFVKKSGEYGSVDLEFMGKAMEILGVEDGQGVEAAIGFYLMGKIGRMLSSWERGIEPSDDTIHDTVIYSKMLRGARVCRRAESNKPFNSK